MTAHLKKPVANGEVEKHWPQILAILIGALSGFTEGLNFSWTSPFVVQITEDKETYDINEQQASMFNTLHPLALIIGCPIFSVLCNTHGRKRTFLLTGILQILGWLFAAFAKDLYLFYLSRICAGLSNACFFAVFPIYVGEIANPTVRGSWGNVLASSMYLGEFVINVVGSYCGVRNTSFIVLPLPVIFLVLFWFMPESPYFCVMKGRDDEAKTSLKFLTRKQNIEKDFLQLKYDVARQLSESGTFMDLVSIISNRRALIAGTFLRMAQQTSGLGIFFIYTQLIFQKSGGNVSHELSSIIMMGVNFLLNIIVLILIVHRFSRKKLFIVSLSSSALILYALGTYFYIDKHSTVDLSSFKWVPITGMLVYMACLSFGVCVIPTLMMSELYSASIKGKAMTILLIFMGAGNILINTSFYYIVEYIDFYALFYCYAICNTVATVLSFFVIPETKGKTLEEIQQMLKTKNMKD